MTSKKRWRRVYSGENPFGLPHSISRNLKQCTIDAQALDEKVHYLWVCLSASNAENGAAGTHNENELSTEQWLGVIDESAAMGATTLIVTLSCAISERRDLLEVCTWAQTAHDMTVGIHLSQCCLSERDAELISRLDRDKILLFVDSDCMENLEAARLYNLRVFQADGIDDDVVQPACTLPETMTCVGSHGTLYTCGLVLGDEQFSLGHFYERKLDNVMTDASLPHSIPAGLKKGTRRCNGCPPLMAQRIAEKRF